MTDEVGNKVRSTEYDPFGNWRAANGQANIQMLYQGQQQDPESNLYYLRARYYDPSTGRFISRDPVKGYLNDPRTQNGYDYALSNPVNLSDPSGEYPLAACAEALCKDGDCTNEIKGVANSAVNAINLAKSLASQQQMQEAGKVIAGEGSVFFRDAAKIAQEYGGQAADWVKKVSSSYPASDGIQTQTHWVENIKTGVRILEKTVMEYIKPKL